MSFLLGAAARAAGGALKGVAQQQGKMLLNQSKKAAMNYTMAHKNQAIAATQNYLKQKAGNLGRAANARVSNAISRVGPPPRNNRRNVLKV
jgi:hypothetical protein